MQLVAVFDECSLPTLPPLLACSVLLLLDQPLLSGGLPSDMSGVFDLKGAIAGAIAGIRDGATQRTDSLHTRAELCSFASALIQFLEHVAAKRFLEQMRIVLLLTCVAVAFIAYL